MPEWSADCREVLRLLSEHRNVLIKGAPGTGKTRLLSEVAAAFEAKALGPVHDPLGPVAIPSGAVAGAATAGLPGATRKNRKVFRTVFHQNSKHREFVTGLVPQPGVAGATQFTVVEGTLFRASEHARSADGASLLIIDEINRGPAVQLFGGALVSLEPDKRLAEDGSISASSFPFELMLPPGGKIEEYYLPPHLYTLAAMNEADTSVEPLDVAFLRRWAHFQLSPSEAVLRAHFGLPAAPVLELPDVADSAGSVYETAVAAWRAINARVQLGRGKEFQLGHGVLMPIGGAPKGTPAEALDYLSGCWSTIKTHIDEVFFGDTRAVAAVLGVELGAQKGHPFTLNEDLFADDVRYQLVGPAQPRGDQLFALLRAVAGSQ